VLGNPRSYAQGWLYLHAMTTWRTLGRLDEADRLLRDKLSRIMRQGRDAGIALRPASGADPAALRQPLQDLLFPHFRDTYWNRLVDEALGLGGTPAA